MASTMQIRVERRADLDTHPLVAWIEDAEDGAIFSDEVHHRDMGHVRAYYNGLIWGMRQYGADVHGGIVLKQHRKWPFSEREFHVPVNPTYVGDTEE